MKILTFLLFAATCVLAKPQGIPDRFQAGVGKTYDRYLNIQQALANDDFQKARTGSDSMLGVLKAIRTNGLKGAAKSGWDSLSTRMTGELQPMIDSKDIKSVRSRFKNLTPLVASAIERFGMKSASPAYLFHCPMANANWLQKDKTTTNPFYGSSMLECGSMVREVKPL